MRPASARLRDRRGIAALETALVAPLFLFVALCTTDLIRLFRAQLRVEAVAVQIGQIVSQCRSITDGSTLVSGNQTDTSDIGQFWGHAVRIAGGVVDVNSATGGAVIITAVGRNTSGGTTTNRAMWRRRTGNTNVTSSLGTTVPGTATISNSFIVPQNQTVFVTEVFAVIEPWVLGAGLIGTVVPSMLNGTTLFLSRAPDPVSLQTAPRVSLTPECTA
ncbi:hypothetical protein GXW74_18475 [Roseomonas eburnea]|uniref:TadE-like domain-containing protein n=1 Tax=Neoroseomonas eburnea TaxID=1346889 RepID=A0A9X9XFJ8_9PROT|nr:TadE/TadG family type IV pilus assembly protein [Neoroseomonas eburnea]MBR0682484.1 hypothetical protein [Neoroseomonas eburnea]